MDRRVLYIMYVVISTLFAASCSENLEVAENYVDIKISTAIEASYLGAAASRAESGFEVDDEQYDMRYTIELWSGDYSEVIYRAEEIVSDIEQSLTHSFRAVVGGYRLVIFADYIATNDETTSYITKNGLNEITITNNNYTANNSSRDCYGYSEDIEITSSFALSNITLKRPMAKMTLANIDPSAITSGQDVSITYGTEGVPNGYDLLNEEVITSEAVRALYPTTVTEQTIAFDYIFVSGTTEYLMRFEVGEKEVSAMINFEENKTTNITATFFETQTD